MYILAVEKNNDDARRNNSSSTHLDAPRDVLLTEARLKSLAEYEREKRQYTQKDKNYWEREIYLKRRRINSNEIDDVANGVGAGA